MRNLSIGLVAIVALAVLAGPAWAALVGELGILTPETLAGDNPATGNPWAFGDPYRLFFITSGTTTAESADITTYDAFVQGLADASTAYNMSPATWKVFGSTDDVDFVDHNQINWTELSLGDPVYQLDGTALVAKDYKTMCYERCNVQSLFSDTGDSVGGAQPWTGSTRTEFPGIDTYKYDSPGLALGDDTGSTTWGNKGFIWGARGWFAYWRGPQTDEHPLYAMSAPLRIVDEVAYWDLNGATEGAGGPTPAGTWDAAGTYWNPELDGTGDPNAWLPGYTAAFAAGGDATGTYTVAVDGTRDISGLSFEEGTVTLAPGADGVLRMTFSAPVDVAAGLTATVQTPISEDATARSLVKRGEGTLILTGANTYTGTTIVNEGALVLSGSPTGQSNTTVNGGGTLKLDYSTNDTGKIHDSAALTLAGGTLELAGGSHTEVVASTTIAAGLSSVNRSSGSATLAMNAITPGPGIVDFAAAGIADTDTLNTNGILGPWATVGNADWAQNSTDAADGPITAHTGYTDIAATGDTVTDGSPTNVRLNSAGSGGNLALSADTTAVNTLLQNTAAATVDTASKTLRTGGIMIGAGQEALTIGVAAGDGTLTVASAGGVLYLINNNAGKNLTVNAVIADNTSPSALATAGNVLLQGVNTYTGATYVNAGTLDIGGAGLLAGGAYSADIAIARGATLKYNSSADQILSGGISGSGGLLKDAAGTLTLAGANTCTGATMIAGGTLQIGSGGGTGSLSTSSAITNNATLVFNRSNVITQGVDFAHGISGSGDVIQAGAGTLILSGTNTYTGMTTVNAGALVPGTTSSLPGYDSAGRVVFDGGTVRVLIGGSGWATEDVDTLLANAARNSGALGIATSHGDLTQWTAFTPANMGALGLTKYGLDALTLDQANTHTGGTTLAAGTLVINHAQALGTGSFTIAGAGTVQTEGSIVTTNPVAANSNFTIAGTGELTLGDMTVSANRTITNNNTTAVTTLGAISGANSTLTFAGNGNTAVTGVIATGTGGLTKAGAGTLTLLNACTYTGNTAVNAGTLKVPGWLGDSDVTVSNADTKITGGGNVNSLAINAGAGFIWGYGDGGDHVMDANTSLSLADNWVLKLVDLGEDPLISEQYDLFTYGTGYTGDAEFSDALENIVIDATDAPDWDISGLSVVDDLAGRVYITGTGLTVLPGDADDNGVVNAADYIILKTHMGQATGATAAEGDFDDDGDVDWADLRILQSNYGATIPGAPGTIPEPATLFIMLAAGLPALLKRRRRA